MKFDLEVDAIGLKCPLPILYCKRGLNSILDNQTLKIKNLIGKTRLSLIRAQLEFLKKEGPLPAEML